MDHAQARDMATGSLPPSLLEIRSEVRAEVMDALSENNQPTELGHLEPESVKSGRGRSTEGQLIYAVGDVHGCYDLLRDMLAKVARSASVFRRGRRPTLILCGDYIDRGPDSARVLDALVVLKQQRRWRVVLLKGNHEAALLRFLDDPSTGPLWMRFGGDATLVSYGLSPPAEDAAVDRWFEVRDRLLDVMPASHLRLLQTLELMVAAGDYAFVHAGVAPGTRLARQVEEDLLWIRDEFLEARGKFEKVIVHGHSFVDEQPVLHPNRIGLDTGAYQTGVLTGVRLDDNVVEPLQVRDARLWRWDRLPGRPPSWSPAGPPVSYLAGVPAGWAAVIAP